LIGDVPGIHVFLTLLQQDMDGRVVKREDGASRLKPGHDEEKLIKYAQTACESAASGFDAEARGDYVMRS
jgi:hypothetical protein